jgi:DNA-binding GntR family transcriptional regulator
MARKLDRPAPPYLQIAEDIKRRIVDGALQPGEHVPSVRAILRDYGVAMATAQRALGTLRAEGYIRSDRGIGSVVTTEQERGRATSDWVKHASATGRIYPPGQHAKIVGTKLVRAPSQVADALGLGRGSKVIRRDRLTYNGDQPTSFSTSWFPGSVAVSAPRLLVPERILEGTFAYVASALGRKVAAWQDQYEPAIVTAAEAARLGLTPGAPVTHGRNWIYDDTGAVLEYGESVSASRITYRGEAAH